MKRVAALLALGLAAAPSAAAACSVEDGYRVPTNMELAAAAETIVLAQVVEGRPDPSRDLRTVTIRPLETLKGDPPNGDIALRGMLVSRDAGPGLAALSNPYEFATAHPISYLGACIRYVFPLGTTALFFLRTDHEGMWAPAAPPFSRWAEDVLELDAPWVQLVRFYVRAAALPEDERRALFQAEREALLARTDEPVAQLMAADIARQLAGPNEPWNAQLRRELGVFGDEGERESAVSEAVRAMREAAEAGE